MSGEKVDDFDECTSFLGDFGHFQILVIALLVLSTVPCGYIAVLVVFMSDTPEHHCKASINSTHNGTWAEQSGLVGPDSCSRYKLNGSLSNDTEQCPEGWVFSTERYTATIVSEWALVCDDAWKVPFSTSLYFVGALIGCFVSGHLSDRFGRKPVFFSTMVLHAVTALIQASSINWVMFCILNCLRGLGQVSNYVSSLVLGSETLSKRARVTYNLLHPLGYGIGYALLPLFAYFIRGWRMLLVASSIPSILFIPMWWAIPESPRWLLLKGRVEEAELIIRNAAKRNKVTAPEVIFTAAECLEQNKTKEERTYTYLDLVRTPNMRNITILCVLLWMSVDLVFFGLSLNTSNLNGNVYLNCFISAAIDIVAYAGTWLLINCAPRPTLFSSTLIFCGIMLLVLQLVPEDMQVMFQVLTLVGRIGISGAYALIFMFFTELIPTVVRNMGLGVASTAARLSTIMCPYLLYTGLYIKILPYIIFGTISIVAAALSLLLPDTRNSKLPELISQVKPIRGCCGPGRAKYTSDTREGCTEVNTSALC